MQQLHAYMRVFGVHRGVLVNFDQRDAVLRDTVRAVVDGATNVVAGGHCNDACIVLAPWTEPLPPHCNVQTIFVRVDSHE